MDRIAISRNADTYRLKSKLHDSSQTATDRHGPHTSAGGRSLPVGGENGCGRQIPSFFHVVVDEVLQQHLINVPAAATTGDRPDVVDERAQYEMPWHRQGDEIGSEGEFP